MSSQYTFSEELINKLSYFEEGGLGETIRDLAPARPSTLRRECLHSSFGLLDTLPPELLLPILDSLDFWSLSRLNHVFWMMTPAHAKTCFGVTDGQLLDGGSPIMRSIPGADYVWHSVMRQRVYRLVSVKQVKQLDIAVHESAAGLAELLPGLLRQTGATPEAWRYKVFHQASLDPPGCDLARRPLARNQRHVPDDHGGKAYISFPFLTEARVPEPGRRCMGCKSTRYHDLDGVLPESVVDKLVPAGVEPRDFLREMQNRLWARDEFLEHIRHCYGVGQLLMEWGEDDSE